MVKRADRIEVTLSLDDIATRELRQFVTGAERGGRRAERSFERVDRAVDKTRLGIGRLAGGVAAAYAAFAVGRRTVGAGFGFVEAASEFEESFSKFQVVFDQESGRVLDRIDEFTAAAGRSRAAFVNFTSGFQDLLVPMGFARQEAADLSVALTELATDVGSFSNRLDADVVADFASALVGNSETVRKYGANLLESEVALEAVRIGLSKTGKELTAQEKVLARISLLYRSTTDAQGDAIRTTDSFANSVKRLQAGIGQLRVEMGTELIAALQRAKTELGGTEAILLDVELAFRAAAISTRGFISIVASLITGSRSLVNELDGPREVLRDFGFIVNATALSVDVLTRSLSLLASIIAAEFETLARTVAKSFNSILGTAERVVNTINTAKAILNREVPKIVDFGFDEGLAKLDFSEVIAESQVEVAKAFNDYDDGLQKALIAFARRSLEFGRIANDFGKGRGQGVAVPDLPRAPDIERLQGRTDFGAPEVGIGSQIGPILQGIAANLDAPTAGLEEATGAAAKLNREAGVSGVEAFKKLAAAIGVAGEKVIELVRATARQQSLFEGARSAVRDYAGSLSDFNLARDAVGQGFGALEDGLRGFSRAVAEGESAFSQYAKTLIKEIGAIITNLLLLRTARAALGVNQSGAVTGGILGFLGFAKGGVIPGGTGPSVPFRAYASGGITNGPELALMGEGRRNEAVIPLPDNRSVPVTLKGAAGGATNITFNVSAFDAKGARDAIVEQARTIEDIIVSGVQTGRNRKLVTTVGNAGA